MGVTDRFTRAFDFLRQRQRGYQLCFNSIAGNAVLADLAKFCRAAESTFHDDPRKHAVLEGRREVFIRIADHLHLTTEQIYALYQGRNVLQPDGDNDG